MHSELQPSINKLPHFNARDLSALVYNTMLSPVSILHGLPDRCPETCPTIRHASFWRKYPSILPARTAGFHVLVHNGGAASLPLSSSFITSRIWSVDTGRPSLDGLTAVDTALRASVATCTTKVLLDGDAGGDACRSQRSSRGRG